MALLGVGKDEFDQFRVDLLGRLSGLEARLNGAVSDLREQVEFKATDAEQEAKEAAERAGQVLAGIKDLEGHIVSAANEIDESRLAVSREAEEIVSVKKKLSSEIDQLESSITNVKSFYDSILGEKDKVDISIADIYAKLSELEKVLSKIGTVNEQVEGISQLSTKASSSVKELLALRDSAATRKTEIDDFYDDIFGRDITKEDGSVVHVLGKVDELSDAYSGVSEKFERLDSDLDVAISNISENYSNGLEQQRHEFSRLIEKAKSRIESVDSELKSLLPGSMAAGLSAAYEAKSVEEKLDRDQYASSFKYAILAMVAVSLIPFVIDAYLLFGKGYDLVQVVKDTPNLVISILPLYLPVLWFAYSANKKLNLSKRLIEEYTHKAVLGKTFSGLSTQIESLPHEVLVKEELRTRLLFNILQVSAENPGKLITDYNKTDHPFMAALENSAKLSESVDALSKLPGFSALAEKLAGKSQKILDDQARKVEHGLAVQVNLNASEDNGESPKV